MKETTQNSNLQGISFAFCGKCFMMFQFQSICIKQVMNPGCGEQDNNKQKKTKHQK